MVHRFILPSGWVVPLSAPQYDVLSTLADSHQMGGRVVVFPAQDQLSVLLRTEEDQVVAVFRDGNIS